MEKEALKKLKGLLPKRWAKDLADQFNVKQNYIRKVMNGEYDRLDIVTAAVEKAERYQEEQKNEKDKISQRIQHLFSGDR